MLNGSSWKTLKDAKVLGKRGSRESCFPQKDMRVTDLLPFSNPYFCDSYILLPNFKTWSSSTVFFQRNTIEIHIAKVAGNLQLEPNFMKSLIAFTLTFSCLFKLRERVSILSKNQSLNNNFSKEECLRASWYGNYQLYLASFNCLQNQLFKVPFNSLSSLTSQEGN